MQLSRYWTFTSHSSLRNKSAAERLSPGSGADIVQLCSCCRAFA